MLDSEPIGGRNWENGDNERASAFAIPLHPTSCGTLAHIREDTTLFSKPLPSNQPLMLVLPFPVNRLLSRFGRAKLDDSHHRQMLTEKKKS